MYILNPDVQLKNPSKKVWTPSESYLIVAAFDVHVFHEHQSVFRSKQHCSFSILTSFVLFCPCLATIKSEVKLKRSNSN